MNIIPNGDNHGGAVCDDPHVRICERRMDLFMRLLYSWLESGFATAIKVVFDRYTGKIITGFPLNGAVKLR